ncbi:hypothetical protein DPMN_122833 [Dreissena polymorpha]|uniref:Uncharacterized protein n=1 Tax=Dreissena polymorpha TaxID=45954 RepID=A0A9D4JQX8_DREPO|nr:hypothetical protein DPMN_122833 [Dreissena polymorpha]
MAPDTKVPDALTERRTYGRTNNAKTISLSIWPGKKSDEIKHLLNLTSVKLCGGLVSSRGVLGRTRIQLCGGPCGGPIVAQVQSGEHTPWEKLCGGPVYSVGRLAYYHNSKTHASIYLSIYTAKRPLEHYRQRDIIESVSWEEPIMRMLPEWGANPRTPDR